MIPIKVLGVDLTDILFFATVFIPFVLSPRFFIANFNAWKHSIISLFLIYIMFSLSVLILNNDFTEALFFVKPILILFITPTVYFLVINGYSLKLIRTIYFCSLFLVFYYIVILGITFYDPSIAFSLSEKSNLFYITYDSFFPRIVFNNFPFVIIPACYSIYFYKSLGAKVIMNILVITIILLSTTFGILLGLITVYVMYFIYKKLYLKLTFFISSVLIASMGVYSSFGENKLTSISYKVQQITNFHESLTPHNFLFGSGIGSKIPALDNRGFSETIIEVTPIMLFLIGGVFGTLIYLYIYFKPLIKHIPSLLFYKKLDNQNIFFISIQLGIVSASVANPYLWSGGVGLIFLTFVESFSIKWKKYQ